MPRHGCRHHLEIGDVDARGDDPGEDAPLEEPAGRGRRPAGGHAAAAVERRSEGDPDAKSGLGRQVDVDEAGDRIATEQAGRKSRFPDEVAVDERAGLDLLERVDPDSRHDHRLVADRAVVADGRALVHARMRADVAGASDHGALDESRAADVGRGVDDRARRARVVPERDAVGEDRIRAHGGSSVHPAVVADERGTFEHVEVLEVDALPHPDVAAEADAWDLEAHALVERVEVRLPELVKVADVLPVAVGDVAVQRPAHLEEEREELLGEVVRTVGGNVLQHLGSST